MPAKGGGLPLGQLLVLCFCTFSGCFNMTLMMPFIPQLVVDLGKATDLREPGFYAGYLVSANQVGRILTSVLWGRFSDKHGRKPVLLYGLGVTGLSALLFGLAARSEPLIVLGLDVRFWFCVAMRLLNGLFDFIFGMAKTMVAEFVPEAHQPRAMALLSSTWGAAVIVGPTIGGVLASPAASYPTLFDPDGFWSRYPYFLPNFVSAVFATLGFLGCWIGLEESGPAHLLEARRLTSKGLDSDGRQQQRREAAVGDDWVAEEEDEEGEESGLLGGGVVRRRDSEGAGEHARPLAHFLLGRVVAPTALRCTTACARSRWATLSH